MTYEPANEPDQLYTGEDAARTPLPVAPGPASQAVISALSGYGHSTWLDQLNATRWAKRMVVKDVRAMGIAGFVVDASKAATVLLLRHPFAVARSVVELGWTDPTLTPRDAFVQEVSTWCEIHVAAARDKRLDHAYLVSYEELLEHPDVTLHELTEWLTTRHATWRALNEVPPQFQTRSATNFRGTTDTTPTFEDIDPAWRAAGLAQLERHGLLALYNDTPGIQENWRDAWKAIRSQSWN